MNNAMHQRSMSAGQQWSVEASARHCLDDGRVIVFAHQGQIDQQTMTDLVGVAERYSLENSDVLTTRKRLVGVLVEGLENAVRHVGDGDRESVFAVLSSHGDRYTITVGNAMPLATAVVLSNRVSILNEMDDADVKEHYLKLLSNTARSRNGGAGLGLLSMARKSLRPIACRTDRLDHTTVGFCLELAVARS
jgi:hypothetical protein